MEAMTKDELLMLTQHIDATWTECDGATRLVHLALLRAGVIHQVMTGHVHYGNAMILPIHYWIHTGRFSIDYRARIWMGPNAPHGVFRPHDYPDFYYIGKPTGFRIEGCLALEWIVSLTTRKSE